MTGPLNVAVLVSTSRHPLSGVACANHNDSLALEVGRQLAIGAAGAAKAVSADPALNRSRLNLRVLHAGDPADPALGDYLAFGAPFIEILPVASGVDVVPVLASELRETHLVLCGGRSQAGTGSGMLPYQLGAALGRPVIADVLQVKLTDSGPEKSLQGSGLAIHAEQFLPKGRRRRVEVPLPAVVAIHPLASVTPRYAYARRVAGLVRALPTAAQSSESKADAWCPEATERMPVRLKAPDRRSGHARMLAATGSSHRGGQVVNEGSSVAKAQAVLTYLREHQLIDF